MHEPVEDGVGVGRFSDHLVPVLHGQLTGHHGEAAPVAVAALDEVRQVLVAHRRA